MIKTSGPRGSEMQGAFVPGDAPATCCGWGGSVSSCKADQQHGLFRPLGTWETCRGRTLLQATLKIRLKAHGSVTSPD